MKNINRVTTVFHRRPQAIAPALAILACLCAMAYQVTGAPVSDSDLVLLNRLLWGPLPTMLEFDADRTTQDLMTIMRGVFAIGAALSAYGALCSHVIVTSRRKGVRS